MTTGAITRLLVANRGEIAIRICRAASDAGITSVAVHSEDDASSLHVRLADEAVALDGLGAAAYLDIEGVVAAAVDASCDAVHPGYGFLAENDDFAAAVEAAGLIFVGPTPDQLGLFGDKARARQAASAADVPVLAGSDESVSLEAAQSFLEGLGAGGAVMLKAVAGGGGRGSRSVTSVDELADAYAACAREAQMAFGNDALFVEEFVANARHIEVQMVGDGSGAVTHLGERECSAQRRYQKVIEMAPAPALDDGLRAEIHAAAMRLAGSVEYRNLGTFEFLVDADSGRFVFIEANARLQVEHTVTEEVSGIDLVATQLAIAAGSSLAELTLTEPVTLRGAAVQCRVNMETMQANGAVMPASGTLASYDPPSGPGVRVDGFGYSGYATSSAFDSLLAKVIVKAPTHAAAIAKSARALSEFRIDGVATNLAFLAALLDRPELVDGTLDTRFIDTHAAELVEAAAAAPTRWGAGGQSPDSADSGLAGAQVDTTDPMALFKHADDVRAAAADTSDDRPELTAADGSVGLPAPIQGTIVAVSVEEGQAVREGMPLVILEAMKMEHVIAADRTGIVTQVSCAVGDVIREGFPLVFVLDADVDVDAAGDDEAIDLDHIRSDLLELYERKAYTLDENRPEAMERRQRKNQWSARQNLEALVDKGSFREYGPLVVAAQRKRRTEEWLRERSPADGLVGGLATVNADLFGPEAARCMAIAYDYTVLAGTQGTHNHYKKDRLFEVARRYKLPLLIYTEGGGGRPGDTEWHNVIGMDTYTFTQFSKLSGTVPLVGLNSGYCFAGNTALLACCDVIIATKGSTIAMGGPAMIEGGGLGVYTPEEVGPMSFQVPNGVVDILVEDDAELAEMGKKYLSYFQGDLTEWESHDQRKLRHIVPENRVRMYDVREVIETLCDVDSVLEIRKDFGIGIITCLARIEGKAVGVIANNPHHLAGAIDSDGADKGARFLQLCDAFGLPVISIMDCPGIMVGPDAEREALVRHAARMFVTGANLTVPMFGLVIRKAYGLGVQAMCGASSMAPLFTVAWPTAEFAGMNIEGSVKLGYRNVIAELETPEERKELFDKMVAKAYESARAVNGAQYFGIDDVIDPAESRDWVVSGLRSLPPEAAGAEPRRTYIDAW
ncbi:MAG: carboxyl transferase domain-containing protein [Actinomycetota bacterium]